MASTILKSRAAAAAATRLFQHHRALSSTSLLLPTSSTSTTSAGAPKLQHLAGSPFLGESYGQDRRVHGGLDGAQRQLWEQDRRRYGASSNTSKSETDGGEAIANQMIAYAATSRKNVESHVEVSRVLEQGYNFLLAKGPSAVNAAGKVLLTLATFHVDGGKMLDAVEVLQQAANLEGASAEVGVSAIQALVGVFLRIHRDDEALLWANLTAKLIHEADGLPVELIQDLKFRSKATVQFVEHVHGCNISGSLMDMSGLSSWINHRDAHVDGVAAALLGIAECTHFRGHLSQAKDYYEKALALAESSLEKGGFVGSSAGAMTADDVLVGAGAGLGQVATHLGDFDDAEAKLTKALTHAEQINGEKHPRVGAVLACLTDVYAQRGRVKGSGDLVLTEGLYRRATELLGAPPLDTQASGQDLDLTDVIAITRARFATLLSRANKRETEAQKLQTWANAAWKGPHSLTDVLLQEASTQTVAKSVDNEGVDNARIGRYVVIDVRLGRVLYSPSNL